MTWKSFQNRGETLRAVIEAAAERRDGVLPMDVPGVAEAFADELDLLASLQLKWHTRLTGHIERRLVAQPLDLRAAVETAWRDAAEELPGVRMILDRYRAEPTDEAMATAMAKATAKEHVLLAVMAGRSSVDDPRAVPIGAAIEEHARREPALDSSAPTSPDTPSTAAGSPAQRGLLERLKAVVAA